MKFLAGIFLSGVLFCYLYHWVREFTFFKKFETSCWADISSGAGTLMILIMLAASAGWLEGLSNANNAPGLYGFLAATSIFLILISSGKKASLIFSILPLRAIGVVGFSFYLLHPLIIWALKGLFDHIMNFNLGGVTVFLMAGAATYVLAAITYTYIERPFLRINR